LLSLLARLLTLLPDWLLSAAETMLRSIAEIADALSSNSSSEKSESSSSSSPPPPAHGGFAFGFSFGGDRGGRREDEADTALPATLPRSDARMLAATEPTALPARAAWISSAAL